MIPFLRLPPLSKSWRSARASKVACLEGIAYRQGWIDSDTLRENAQPMLKNDYGKYLLSILEEKYTLKKNLEY